MGNIAICVKDLWKSYGKHAVLSGLNFQVERGTIFALLGENGAGKTTTVRILSTLTYADRGEAIVEGFNTKQEAHSVKKVISLTGQFASVDEMLTGEENLMMMGRLNHLDRNTVKKRTAELLEQFDLLHVAKKRAKSYSGGTRRRLDIAVGLIRTPKVIFLDEPTTGLDPRSRKNIWQLIKQLASSGTTILLTTQYLEEADQLADHIAIMDGGKIIKEGTAEELKMMIGEERLQLSFADRDTLQKAQLSLKGNMNEAERSLSVVCKSPENLRQILNRLHEIDIVPESISIRKPTLDDVFMRVTRNRAQETGGN